MPGCSGAATRHRWSSGLWSRWGHLGRWLEREALAVDRISDEAVSSFLAEYRDERGRLPGASAWPLLEYLRAKGAVPAEPPAVVVPIDQLVGEYREWLLCERGLAPVTARSSEQFARRFLAERVSPGDPRGVQGITVGEVNDFLVRECARVSTGSATCFTYRLRSLLRYLAVRGVADPGLALAVPRVARWRAATIPQLPARPELDRLLASCARDNATGTRDYAVLLLLARLGCARSKSRDCNSMISIGVRGRSPSTARHTDATSSRCRVTSARRSSSI